MMSIECEREEGDERDSVLGWLIVCEYWSEGNVERDLRVWEEGLEFGEGREGEDSGGFGEVGGEDD